MNTPVRYLKNPDVIIREEDDNSALVFNPDTEGILVLNPTAFFIWQHCDGDKSLKDLTSVVANHFDNVPLSDVENHVTKYVSDMVTAGFIGTVEA